MVRELIASGAKMDLQDNDRESALFIASLNGHTEVVVRELIAKGVTKEGWSICFIYSQCKWTYRSGQRNYSKSC